MSDLALIIRADACDKIGAGHVMRCIAIAQNWKDKDGKVAFLSAGLPAPLRARIESEGFQCIAIQSTMGTLEDARELTSLAMQLDARAVILDGYHFDERYHEFINQCGSVTLAIDDDGRLPRYSTDFVLNQNLGATPETYRNADNRPHLLLGTEYALLRREFLQTNTRGPVARSENQPFRCVVTLGGLDLDNVTARVIQGLQMLEVDDLAVHVIVGALNPHGNNLFRLVSGDTRFRLLHDVRDMASQYLWANFAIAAGGSSNWEMCYFGLPRVVVVIADNQREIAEQLQRAHVAINVGEGSDISPERIAAAVDALRLDDSRLSLARERARQLVDGLGAKRCVDRLLNFSRPSRLNGKETRSS